MDTEQRLLLIVEDDEAFARTLARSFERRGYQVLHAESMAQMQVLLATHTPAYAVVDLKLKGEASGLACVRQLHAHSSKTRIVVLTAPLAYLVLNVNVMVTSAATVLGYALPHLLLAVAANHRIQKKYRSLFWGEVYETVLAFQLVLHHRQVIGQTGRAIRTVAVHLFDPARQTDQFRQLFAMAVVEAEQDVFDQRCRRHRAPVTRLARGLRQQHTQSFDDGLCIDAPLGRGLLQAVLSAAAEIQLVFVEHPGGAGNAARQRAEGLVDQVHGEDLVGKKTPSLRKVRAMHPDQIKSMAYGN